MNNIVLFPLKNASLPITCVNGHTYMTCLALPSMAAPHTSRKSPKRWRWSLHTFLMSSRLNHSYPCGIDSWMHLGNSQLSPNVPIQEHHPRAKPKVKSPKQALSTSGVLPFHVCAPGGARFWCLHERKGGDVIIVYHIKGAVYSLMERQRISQQENTSCDHPLNTQ